VCSSTQPAKDDDLVSGIAKDVLVAIIVGVLGTIGIAIVAWMKKTAWAKYICPGHDDRANASAQQNQATPTGDPGEIDLSDGVTKATSV
jgi:hypothetical protein